MSVGEYADRVADLHERLTSLRAAKHNDRAAHRSLDAESTMFFKCPPLTTQLVYPPVDTTN